MADEKDGVPDGRPEPVRRGGREGQRNVSTKEALAARQKALDKQAQTEGNDLAWLMQHPQFQRYVWRQIAQSGFFRRPRVLNAEGYILQGRAEMGEAMWNEMKEVNPDGLIAMMKASMTEEM